MMSLPNEKKYLLKRILTFECLEDDAYLEAFKVAAGTLIAPEEAMSYAYLLALKGHGNVSPNPPVGCVLVDRDHRLLGAGYHRALGAPHAEEEALRDAKAQGFETHLAGATAYVTLEPCAHQGKRPPCVGLLLQHHIGRVVFAAIDSDARVMGRGAAQLAAAGVVCENPAEFAALVQPSLEAFQHNRREGASFIALKAGLTLDGSIAFQGDRRNFLTSERARRFTHFLRQKYDAVMIGIGTLFLDDPMLDIRSIPSAKTPGRIIFDPEGKGMRELLSREGWNPRLAQGKAEILWVHEAGAGGVDWHFAAKTLIARGWRLNLLPYTAADAGSLSRKFLQLGVHSVLLEGGSSVYRFFIEQGLIQKVYLIFAPQMMTGNQRINLFSGSDLMQHLKLKQLRWQALGQDMLAQADLSRESIPAATS